MKAFGKLDSGDKWTRNRPLVSQCTKDIKGNLHCRLRFHSHSSERIGMVHAELVQYSHPLSTNDDDDKKKIWYTHRKYNKPFFTNDVY